MPDLCQLNGDEDGGDGGDGVFVRRSSSVARSRCKAIYRIS